MKVSFILFYLPEGTLMCVCVCALVLIRISLNFITVIPRTIIAEDVKYRKVLHHAECEGN